MTGASNCVPAALVGVFAVLFAEAVGAQLVGAILTGTVADPSGASVPNATVTIQNIGTRVVTVTQANAAGIYSAANLLPGEYTISADAPGLTSGELLRLALTVGENRRFGSPLGSSTDGPSPRAG